MNGIFIGKKALLFFVTQFLHSFS